MTFLRCLSLSILIILSSCSKEKKEHTPPPIEVTSYTVEPKTIPAVFDFIGFAESSHPVEIRAKVEGYLDKIAYQEGQQVKEGDLLFQLDPRQYQAKVEEAKGEVLRQQALLQNAILTVDRLGPLFAQKAASKKDLDNAVASQLAYAAAVQSAQANLLEAQINLDYTTIRSPITGLAAKAKWREGSLINPGSNSLMTTVSVVDPIWIYFTISDNDLLRASRQESENGLLLPKEDKYKVQAIMSDGTVFPYTGVVDYASPTYNQSTGTIQVRGVFPNPKNSLLPGQFVRVKVYGAERPNAIIVPQRALMQKKNGMYVYLIRDNKAVSQDVSTGEWYGDYQIITNGLKSGDEIIVDGINKVIPGQEVKVIGPWVAPSNALPTLPKAN